MAKSDEAGRDANGNVDPKKWSPKHAANGQRGKHADTGKQGKDGKK